MEGVSEENSLYRKTFIKVLPGIYLYSLKYYSRITYSWPQRSAGIDSFLCKNIFKTESFALVMPNAAQKHTSHFPWVNSLKKKSQIFLVKLLNHNN